MRLKHVFLSVGNMPEWHTMQIGAVKLDTPVFLAPMAGITDLPFRLLCRELGGVGLACSELLNSHAIVKRVPAVLAKATPPREDSPICIQVYGNVEDPLPEAAAWAAGKVLQLSISTWDAPLTRFVKRMVVHCY